MKIFIYELNQNKILIKNLTFNFTFRGFGFVTFADPAAIEVVLAVRRHEIDEKMVESLKKIY